MAPEKRRWGYLCYWGKKTASAAVAEAVFVFIGLSVFRATPNKDRLTSLY